MNIVYYESVILEQQINYYILETKINDQKTILNESIGDKLKSTKKLFKKY